MPRETSSLGARHERWPKPDSKAHNALKILLAHGPLTEHGVWFPCSLSRPAAEGRAMASALSDWDARAVAHHEQEVAQGLHDGAVWGEVVGDLAALGYDVTWDCLPAAAVGAPHRRDRVFAIAAYAGSDGLWEQPVAEPGRGSTPVVPQAAAALADDVLGGRPAGPGRPVPQRDGREGQDRPATDGGPEVAADAGRRRQQQLPAEHSGESSRSDPDTQRRGVRVEWGPYGPAIERWERVFGPAPEPLVCRVDDRRAIGVERSRLSALGDGVQVQVGLIAGAYIVDLERRRLAGEGLDHAA